MQINGFFKQEAHGSHRPPEKPVLINTFAQSFDYIITLIWRVKRESPC